MPLEFTEYRLARGVGGAMPQIPQGQELATQSIAIGGVNALSAPFNAKTDFIVISKVDADARIAFGQNPVAVAGAGGARYVKAGSEYAFTVDPGTKLGVINA